MDNNLKTPDVAATSSRRSDPVAFEAIEGSKENIQPLLRSTTKRVQSLAENFSKNTKELTEKQESERKQWEDQIAKSISNKKSTGSDDLLLWQRYIKWTKNNFASPSSQQAQLLPLLERCTQHFVNDARYQKSKKYLRVWLEYANLCPDALDVFKFIKSRQIGLDYALFWRAWSIVAEQNSLFDLAARVLLDGKQRGAQPASDLDKSIDLFVGRMQRRLDTFEIDAMPPQVSALIASNASNASNAPNASGRSGASSTTRTNRNNNNNNFNNNEDDGMDGRHSGDSSQNNNFYNSEQIRSRRRRNGAFDAGGRNDGNIGNNASNTGFEVFSDPSGSQRDPRGLASQQQDQTDSQPGRGVWSSLGSQRNRLKENTGIARQWQTQSLGTDGSNGSNESNGMNGMSGRQQMQARQSGRSTRDRNDFYARKFDHVSNADYYEDENGFQIHIDEELRSKEKQKEKDKENKKHRSKKKSKKWKYSKPMGHSYQDGKTECVQFYDPSLLSFGGQVTQFEEVRFYKMKAQWDITYEKQQRPPESSSEEEDDDMMMTTNVSRILMNRNVCGPRGFLAGASQLSPVCEVNEDGQSTGHLSGRSLTRRSACSSSQAPEDAANKQEQSQSKDIINIANTAGASDAVKLLSQQPKKSALKHGIKRVNFDETEEQAERSRSHVKKKLRKGTPYHPPASLKYKLAAQMELDSDDEEARNQTQSSQNNQNNSNSANLECNVNKNDSNGLDALGSGKDQMSGHNGVANELRDTGSDGDMEDIDIKDNERSHGMAKIEEDGLFDRNEETTEIFDIGADTTHDGVSFGLMNQINDTGIFHQVTSTLHSQMSEPTPRMKIAFDSPAARARRRQSNATNRNEMNYNNNNNNNNNSNNGNDSDGLNVSLNNGQQGNDTSLIFNGEQTGNISSYFNKPMKISNKRANDTPTGTVRIKKVMPTPTATLCTRAAMKEVCGMFNDDPTATITHQLASRAMGAHSRDDDEMDGMDGMDGIGAVDPAAATRPAALDSGGMRKQRSFLGANGIISNPALGMNAMGGMNEMEAENGDEFCIYEDTRTIHATQELMKHKDKEDDARSREVDKKNCDGGLVIRDPFDEGYVSMLDEARLDYYLSQEFENVVSERNDNGEFPCELMDENGNIDEKIDEIELNDEVAYSVRKYLDNVSFDGYFVFHVDDVMGDGDNTGRLAKINSLGSVKEYHILQNLHNAYAQENNEMRSLFLQKVFKNEYMHLFSDYICCIMQGERSLHRVLDDYILSKTAGNGTDNSSNSNNRSNETAGQMHEKIILYYLFEMCQILFLLHKKNVVHGNWQSKFLTLKQADKADKADKKQSEEDNLEKWSYDAHEWRQRGLRLSQFYDCIDLNELLNDPDACLLLRSDNKPNKPDKHDKHDKHANKFVVVDAFQRCKMEMYGNCNDETLLCWSFECDYFGVLGILLQMFGLTCDAEQCLQQVAKILTENCSNAAAAVAQFVELIKYGREEGTLEFEDDWKHVLKVIFDALLNENVRNGQKYLELKTKEKREYFETNLFEYLINRLPAMDEKAPLIEKILMHDVVSKLFIFVRS